MGGLGDNLRQIKWDMASLAKFEKNFYEEDKRVVQRSEQDVEAFRREKEIQVFGRAVPKPVHDFTEANFPDCTSASPLCD